MEVIDLRSDTITRPTQAMRDAMAAAEVGDDVFGDDPTVNALQAHCAERVGMEAGLFVPSGTMANQIAAWVHTGRQGQIVCDANSHVALYEGGAAAMISGTTLRTVQGAAGDGTYAVDDVRPHLWPDDPHFAQTKALFVENTHNWAGGTIWDADAFAELAGFAHAHGAAVHIDGARIWNATVASGLPATAWTANADSLMFCFSKGLSAPIGSMLCGSQQFIDRARYVRKWLGGGMRQAGTIAAAAQVAMDSMIDRLADDHAAATALAEGLAKVDTLQLLSMPQTNIVYVDVAQTGLTADDFVALMEDIGVRCLQRDAGTVVRFVTNRHVSVEDCREAAGRIRDLLAEPISV